jgi:hypothetical protein
MTDRLRQFAVIAFALLDIASSFWLGDSFDQLAGVDAPPSVYFLPFNLTFAIWGLIFSSQFAYAVYQALPAQRERALHRRIGWWIALNAALTALWNFTAGIAGQPGDLDFQPLLVSATAVILAGMLFALTQTFITFRQMHVDLTGYDRWLAQFPFTVFFAWLNVAMIANTTAALNALGVPSEPNGAIWAAGMLIVAALLAALMIRYSRPRLGTVTYTAVIVWAITGIFFNNVQRSVLVTGVSVAVALIVITVALIHLNHDGNLRGTRLELSGEGRP